MSEPLYIVGQNDSLILTISEWACRHGLDATRKESGRIQPPGRLVWIAERYASEIPRELLPLIASFPSLACLPHDAEALARKCIDTGFAEQVFIPTSERVLCSKLELLIDNTKSTDAGGYTGHGTMMLASLAASLAGRRTLELARQSALLPAPVLLAGEEGVEFEPLARAVHAAGLRSVGPFVRVDASTTGDRMMSERIPEACGQAAGGTLFIHRVDMLDPDAQKILSFRLSMRNPGGREPSGWKLIASSVSSLDALARSGNYLRTLADQLSVFVLQIPPVRERLDGFAVLCSELLRELAAQLKVPEKRLSPEVTKQLATCRWPFNVAELRAVLENGMSRSLGDEIGVEEISLPGETSPLERKLWLTPDGQGGKPN